MIRKETVTLNTPACKVRGIFFNFLCHGIVSMVYLLSLESPLKMKTLLGIWLLTLAVQTCDTNPTANEKEANVSAIAAPALPDTMVPVVKSPEEWKKQLTDQEYYVLREKGTERAFSGDLWDHHDKGTYTCAGCGLPLFSSAAKFESGTGWPSFFQPLNDWCVAGASDASYGMVRTEVLCARCGGHLGHVFDDGPRPTGLRYCMNSVSLNFVKEE